MTPPRTIPKKTFVRMLTDLEAVEYASNFTDDETRDVRERWKKYAGRPDMIDGQPVGSSRDQIAANYDPDQPRAHKKKDHDAAP